jgi:Pyruvate/2-oxoacid:ferredoxin oxidoreductase delta subunit
VRTPDDWRSTLDKRGQAMLGDKKTWHGIPRDEIPWKPAVHAEACIGCQLCYVTGGRGVCEMQDSVAVPVAAMECVVGCSTCGNVGPTGAITFPALDMVWKVERERQIFRTVKKEAMARHEREEARKTRAKIAAASAAAAAVPTRTRVEVAGAFHSSKQTRGRGPVAAAAMAASRSS